MNPKVLIIFALVGIAALIGFNLFNGNSDEPDVAVVANSNEGEAAITESYVGSDEVSNTSSETSTSTDVNIANKPLGQQPKAIIDKVTTDIDQAQQIDQQRLEQMSDAE